MSPVLPSPSKSSRRGWVVFLLCALVILGVAAMLIVKACPPVPAPAGKPVDDVPVIVKPADAKPVDAPAPAPAPAPAVVPAVEPAPALESPAPVIVVPAKAGPK